MTKVKVAGVVTEGMTLGPMGRMLGMREDVGERGHVTDTDAGEDLVDDLVRWEAAGAVWRVVQRSGDTVSVALLRCDGGEEVGRLVSDSPVLIDFLAGRESSED